MCYSIKTKKKHIRFKITGLMCIIAVSKNTKNFFSYSIILLKIKTIWCFIINRFRKILEEDKLSDKDFNTIISDDTIRMIL